MAAEHVLTEPARSEQADTAQACTARAGTEQAGITQARPEPGAVAGAGSLSERDRAILAFERQWWKYAGAKETAIRELFDLSATRYYQTLNTLIDDPAALAADPLLVKRLQRMRDQRHRRPSARRLGGEV